MICDKICDAIVLYWDRKQKWERTRARDFRLICWLATSIENTYKNVTWDKNVSHLLSFIIILCVGDVPLCTIVWWLLCCGRRMVDIKLVSQAFVANDKPRRWCIGWFCLQHKYRWKCWRNTPDTQYKATGFTHEFRKLLRPMCMIINCWHQNHQVLQIVVVVVVIIVVACIPYKSIPLRCETMWWDAMQSRLRNTAEVQMKNNNRKL